jgi:tubby-related protein 1
LREKQRRKRETRWQKWILQFGKIGEDVYTMDFRYPFTPLQAFMVCATSLDKKLGCE